MNKFKKIILSLILIILASGCKKEEVKEQVIEKTAVIEESKEKKINEIHMKTATFLSKIIVDNIKDDNFKFTLDEENNYSRIEQGDFDIAVVPGYLAPYFYNKTKGNIELAAITATGNLFLLSDTKLNNKMDLKGKNLYIPDLVGNLNNIVEDKIGPLNLLLRLKVSYFTSMSQIIEKMDNSSNYLSILSEPYFTKTLKNNNLYVSKVDDLISVGDGDFISEVIIVNKNYLKNNEEAFREFLKLYKESADKLGKDIEISSEILSEYNITSDQAKKAIDNINITYVDGNPMKDIYQSFINNLYQLDNNIFAGEKPGDDFYYKN